MSPHGPACSRALTACATVPCLPQWKGFCLDELEGKWDFQGNWQDSYLLGKQVGEAAAAAAAAWEQQQLLLLPPPPLLCCGGR